MVVSLNSRLERNKEEKKKTHSEFRADTVDFADWCIDSRGTDWDCSSAQRHLLTDVPFRFRVDTSDPTLWAYIFVDSTSVAGHTRVQFHFGTYQNLLCVLRLPTLKTRMDMPFEAYNQGLK